MLYFIHKSFYQCLCLTFKILSIMNFLYYLANCYYYIYFYLIKYFASSRLNSFSIWCFIVCKVLALIDYSLVLTANFISLNFISWIHSVSYHFDYGIELTNWKVLLNYFFTVPNLKSKSPFLHFMTSLLNLTFL